MTGLTIITMERVRQQADEGFTAARDDGYINGELRDAAIAYAQACDARAGENAADCWPWDMSWWKPSDDPIRNLAKAGALIAAEIDRLQRLRS